MGTRSGGKKPGLVVRQFAQSCMEDMGHTDQVTHLGLRLFDELKTLHKMGDKERLLLEYAALLHDIGWVQGWKGHHKSSLQMILESQKLPFDSKERLMIGSVARYHRKALPSQDHDHYAALNLADQQTISQLAALLRVADGLDRTHTNAVSDLHCFVDEEEVVIRCVAARSAEHEEKYATEKADLFTLVYKKRVTIRMQTA